MVHLSHRECIYYTLGPVMSITQPHDEVHADASLAWARTRQPDRIATPWITLPPREGRVLRIRLELVAPTGSTEDDVTPGLEEHFADPFTFRKGRG